MTEPENLVSAHLRELRADMSARFDAVEQRFEAVELKRRVEQIETAR